MISLLIGVIGTLIGVIDPIGSTRAHARAAPLASFPARRRRRVRTMEPEDLAACALAAALGEAAPVLDVGECSMLTAEAAHAGC